MDVTRPLRFAIVETVPLDGSRRAFTAMEAAQLVLPRIRPWGEDGRLYLILTNELLRDGTSFEWEFHVLFPTLRSEGIWRVRPSEDALQSVISVKIAPVPEPGTTEYLMAQISPQFVTDQENAWNDRLTLIVPLPTNFIDSPAVAVALERQYPYLFASGPIRLKARRMPTGTAVWETKGVDLLHVAFTASPGWDSEPLVVVAEKQFLEA